MDILVIGRGVSGLTTGIRLLENGHQVTIWTREVPGSLRFDQSPAVTSEVAAAVWYPYKAYPQDRVNAWGAITYAVFADLAAKEPPEVHGVVMSEVLEAFPEPVVEPWWVDTVRETFRHAEPNELPAGYQDGYVFAAPVIDMSIYLNYLQRRFTYSGGQVIERAVSTLEEALTTCQLVVNCAGLGAREL